MPPCGSYCERLRIKRPLSTQLFFYHEHETVLERLTIASLLTYVGDVASHCKAVLKPSVKKDGLYRWSGNGICLDPANTIIVSVKLGVVSVQVFWFPNKHFWFLGFLAKLTSIVTGPVSSIATFILVI